jgi:methyl-accepting chemotaxis protein
MWTFVNSRLPISARLSLISVCFLAPIALLTYLFVHQATGDIAFAGKEIAGAQYLTDIWPNFARAAGAEGVAATPMASAAQFDPQFGSANASNVFVQATDRKEKLAAGKTLIGAVADGSNLTLDPDLDSFYAMDAATVRLPGIVAAAVALGEAAGQANSDARLVNVAFAVDQLQTFSDDADASLSAAMKNNAAGDTSRALSDDAAALKTAVGKVLAQGKALLQNQPADALAADEAALLKQVDVTWRATDKELARLLQARADSLTTNLTTKLAIVGAALFATLLLQVGVARGVARPLGGLTRGMRELADGNFDVVLPGLDRQDEIGQIANAVGAFKAKAALRAKHEADLALRRQGDEAAAQARTAAEREKVAAEQTVAIEQLGAALVKLSEKNLTHRMSETLPETYRKLQADFNGAIEQLASAFESVKHSVESVRAGTQQITVAASDLSRRTEQQASSLEETAAALDEVTTTVRKTADGAKQAREVVSSARDDAERGGKIVSKAVEAMGKIEKSSQQISQIIGVIDEIAFQTNLLALNAGVEAARAGESGRGFAVVASEVRALAQRSAEAAKEIKALISASAVQVGEGVDLVAETGKALGLIEAKVAEINTVVTEIAASAQEQATGLQQVNAAVNQMDQTTQQNAAMSEQANAAGRSLAQESERLSQLVEQFQIGPGGGDTLRRELKKAAPHAFAERTAAPPPASRAAAKAPADRGRRVAAGASADGDWTEF